MGVVGGLDLKIGVIHTKVILVSYKILDKTSIFWPNISKILSKCITELTQDKFSFTFPCLLFQSGFELMYRGSGNTIPFSFLI